MKKVVFVLQTMVLGGVESELLTLLDRIPQDGYQVSVVVLYVQDRSIVERIPSHIRFRDLGIDREYYCGSTASLARARLGRLKVREAISLAVKRVLGIGLPHVNMDISGIPPLEGEYDCAVCYHLHSPLAMRYVAEKVVARKRVAWIHNDLATTGYRPDRMAGVLGRFDQFVAVSRRVEREFRERCGDRHRTRTIHNILDDAEIIRKSRIPVDDAYFSERRTRILTVGRMETQKGYDLAVRAAAILKRQRIDFRWYFLGEGTQAGAIRDLVRRLGLEEQVELLGRRDNPYPYLRGCDLYVQPSRHEAWCLAVTEAKILAKPIICTAFAGSDEQIEDGRNGLIVPCDDPEALAERIRFLLENREVREAFRRELGHERSYSLGLEEILRCLD